MSSNVFETLFAPKEGFVIAHVFATTFTFHRRMLADFLIYIYAQNHGLALQEASLLAKLTLLKKAHAENLGKLQIVAHKSDVPSIGISNQQTKNVDLFLSLIQAQYVIPKEMKKGFFHPKIILVAFEKGDGENKETYYKLLISSKNLVYDAFQQHGMFFESACTCSAQNSIAQNRSGHNSTGSVLAQLIAPYHPALAQEIATQDFVLQGAQGAAQLSFHLGTPCADAMLQAVRTDARRYQEHIFITDTIDIRFPVRVLGLAKKQAYTMVANERSFADYFAKNTKNTFPNASEQITLCAFREKNHAKTYLFYDRTGKNFGGTPTLSVWSGSANCTRNAYQNNYEIMVHYTCAMPNTAFDEMKLALLESTEVLQGVPTVEPDLQTQCEALLAKCLQGNGALQLCCNIEQNPANPASMAAWQLILNTKPLLQETLFENTPFEGSALYFSLPNAAKYYEITDETLVVKLNKWNFPREKVGFLTLKAQGNMNGVTCAVSLAFSDMVAFDDAYNTNGAVTQETALYHDILPNVRDFIPPAKKNGIPYDSTDTAQTRLAKFYANDAARLDEISQNIVVFQNENKAVTIDALDVLSELAKRLQADQGTEETT